MPSGRTPKSLSPIPSVFHEGRLRNVVILEIEKALKETHGNIMASSRLLGISKLTLYRYAKKFNFDFRSYRRPVCPTIMEGKFISASQPYLLDSSECSSTPIESSEISSS